MDIVGSGNETAAHILENGRITFMFCAFDGAPNILRLYGTAKAITPNDAEWTDLSTYFQLQLATRQIIIAHIHKVQTSCGYGVPLYDFRGERDQAEQWAESKGADGLEKYKQEKNRISIDGLPTSFY